MKTYQVEIQAIATSNDDGSNGSSVTAAGLQTRIPDLNKIYEAAGIEFTFDPSKDFFSRKSTVLNNKFTVNGKLSHYTDRHQEPPSDKGPHTKARIELASDYPRKVVLYFSFEGELAFSDSSGHWEIVPPTGNSSGWNAFYVSMGPGLAAAPDLAHEIGHYLQLQHPFSEAAGGSPKNAGEAASAIRRFVEDDDHPADEGLDVFDGDRLSVGDTPADAHGTIMATNNPDTPGDADAKKCGPIGKVKIPVVFDDLPKRTYTLEPDRSLVMSYFKGCPGKKTFSPHQVTRIRKGLEGGIRHRLISLREGKLKGLVARTASHSAGAVSSVRLAQVDDGRIVTAVESQGGHLKLIVWDIAKDGREITRKGDAEAGPASKIRVCGLALDLVVTAHRNGDGDLELIVWRINRDGQIERLHSISGDSINAVTMCRVSIEYTEYVVTAARDDDDELQLTAWQITPHGRIIKKADASAEEVRMAGICSFGPDGIVTYLQMPDGKLKAVLWQVQSEEIVRLKNHLTDTTIDDGAFCNLDVDLAVSAVRTHGKLQISTWETREEEIQLHQTADHTDPSGEIGEMAACRVGTSLLVTAIQDAGKKLKVILWEVRDKHDVILRHDSDQNETASNIAVCHAGSDRFAVAFSDKDGNLKVTAWQVS